MNIVAINVSASIMILLTLLIRKAAKQIVHNSVFCLLWVIIAIRLILPLSVETSFSFLNSFMKARNEFTYGLRIQELTAYNVVENINAAQNVVDRNGHHLFYLWLIGCCIVGAYFIWGFIKVRKYVQDAEPMEHAAWMYEEIQKLNFIRCISLKGKKNLATPATWGILNPTIFFPKEFDFRDREKVRFVLYHECGHIKYFHFVLKLLHILLVCLYWYNPFVWTMYIYQERDLEITSDRFALRQMGYDCRRDYANNLLDAAKKQKSKSANFLHFYKKSFLEERVKTIMNFKRMTIGAAIMTLLIPMGMTTAFATTDIFVDTKNTDFTTEFIIPENIYIVDQQGVEDIEEEVPTSIDVEWSQLQPYVTEGESRAASYLIVEYYEHVTYGRIPPKAITVSTVVDGYTYRGTLDRVDYVYQNSTDKYTGFYSGKIYRQ